MSSARLWHERSTFRYILIGVLLAFASAFFSYLLNIHGANPAVTGEHARSNGSLGLVNRGNESEMQRGPAPAGDASHREADLASRSEALMEQYDALNTRLAAAEASFETRARDLGDLPLKPEIASAIATSRLDLEAARDALSKQDYNQASARITRAQKLLEYLENL